MLKKYMRRNEKEIGSRASGRMVEKPEVRMRYNWHRYFQKIWMFAGMLILSFLMQLLISSAQQSRIQQGIAGEVLRFHVLANSDSREDQAVKLQVRDAVLQWMENISETGKRAITSTDKAESDLKKEETTGKANPERDEILQFLKSHLPEIEAVANQMCIRDRPDVDGERGLCVGYKGRVRILYEIQICLPLRCCEAGRVCTLL